jgi:hypothetical protein
MVERQPDPPDACLSLADLANRVLLLPFQASRRMIRAAGQLIDPGLEE